MSETVSGEVQVKPWRLYDGDTPTELCYRTEYDANYMANMIAYFTGKVFNVRCDITNS